LCRVVLIAWAATLATWYLLPAAFAQIGTWLVQQFDTHVPHYVVVLQMLVLALQAGTALFLGWSLHRRLVRRNFSLRIA
jgi:hypothetical protein